MWVFPHCDGGYFIMGTAVTQIVITLKEGVKPLPNIPLYNFKKLWATYSYIVIEDALINENRILI